MVKTEGSVTRTRANVNSFQIKINGNAMAEKTAGLEIGRIIWINVWNLDAPSKKAASSKESGRETKKFDKIKMPRGI